MERYEVVRFEDEYGTQYWRIFDYLTEDYTKASYLNENEVRYRTDELNDMTSEKEWLK